MYSKILAWKIPKTVKPGGLQSMGWRNSQIQLSNKTTNNYTPDSGQKGIKLANFMENTTGLSLSLSLLINKIIF